MTELGKRAVACRGWRWMPGMRTYTSEDMPPGRITDDGFATHGGKSGLVVCKGDLPDFSDPLTALALLVLVREAYKTPSMFVRCEHDGLWRVCWSDGKFSTAVLWAASAKTEVEALLNALEVAPCEEVG